MAHPQVLSAQAERDAIARIRAGDYDAFVTVFRTYYGAAREFAARLLQSDDAADDIAQDVFFAIWRQRETWVVTSSLASYIYGAVRNRAITQLRHRRVRTRLDGLVRSALERVAPRADTEVLTSDLEAEITRIIARLPRRCREVYELRWYHQLSYAEIAQLLGISARTVESHVATALKLLRTRLQPFT